MTAQTTTTTTTATAAASATTATRTAPAIEVRGLRKSFGKQVVLDGIDLEVAEGTVFALLGPNGAGKTTAVHILSTLISADAGEVRVAGFDVARIPTPSAASSASPARSRRSTASSRARRTCA